MVVEGESSEPRQVILGVPQGSILGPQLFIIYVDDVSDLGSRLALYDDDMLLYKTVNTRVTK